MDIKIANALFDDGTFTAMYKAGWISEKVFIDREIYLYVDMLMRTRNISKYKAAQIAADKFECDITTIYRSVKKFE